MVRKIRSRIAAPLAALALAGCIAVDGSVLPEHSRLGELPTACEGSGLSDHWIGSDNYTVSLGGDWSTIKINVEQGDASMFKHHYGFGFDGMDANASYNHGPDQSPTPGDSLEIVASLPPEDAGWLVLDLLRSQGAVSEVARFSSRHNPYNNKGGTLPFVIEGCGSNLGNLGTNDSPYSAGPDHVTVKFDRFRLYVLDQEFVSPSYLKP